MRKDLTNMDVCSCIRAGAIHQYVSIQTWPILCCCIAVNIS